MFPVFLNTLVHLLVTGYCGGDKKGRLTQFQGKLLGEMAFTTAGTAND